MISLLNEYTIMFLPDVEGNLVKDLALSAAAILQSETGGNTFQASDGDAAVYASQGVEFVGFVIIRWWPAENCAFIGLAWTRPDMRRKGVYRALFEAAKPHVIAKGYTKIECAIHPSNEVSLATHRSIGFKATVTQLEVVIA